jgi:alpha-tubulin suppressor-like RCC1 family protein
MKPPAQIKTVRKKIVALCTFLLLIGFAQTESSFAVDSGPTFKSVSSGEHFTCGLTTTGDVYCWGANENSQLGTSAVSANSTPNKVYQISNALEITSGRDFACARISDGGVACWGRGDLGQTGDGIETKIDRIFATRVHSINTAIGI